MLVDLSNCFMVIDSFTLKIRVSDKGEEVDFVLRDANVKKLAMDTCSVLIDVVNYNTHTRRI
jgi:hypothetical protein